MLDTVIASGIEGRKKILKGATLVGEIVGSSLGPRGRNTVIKTKYSAPNIVNDGVTIARNIMLDDEIEDLGAQALIEGAMKTDEQAHDGTTTCIVVASEAVKSHAKKIEETDKEQTEDGTAGGGEALADVNSMAREILDTGKYVVEELKKMARPLKKNELKNVIATSLGKLFPEFIDTITHTIEETGADGYVSVDDNWHTKYGVETACSVAASLITAEVGIAENER